LQNIVKRIVILRKTQCEMKKNIPQILPTNNRHLMPHEKFHNYLMLNK